MPPDSSTKAGRKRQGRSRVSNGSDLFLLPDVDGRSAPARRFADVLGEIVSDLGGEGLSEGQRQLARRCALISIQCEQIEAEAIAAGTISDERLESYGKLTDRLGRAFQRLGLKRQARDITPKLDDILAGLA